MSIRSAISGLLSGDGIRSDPAAALEEAGYEGISAEEFGTALTHFAETATLEEADALAPVVTRTGPVPLTQSDLPEIAADDEPDDSFGLFSRTVTDVHQDYGESDLDEFDDDPGLEPVVDNSEDTNPPNEFDLRFGEPSSQDQPLDRSLDENTHDDAFDDVPLEQPEPIATFDESDIDDAFDSEDLEESIDATTSGSESDQLGDTVEDDLDFDI